MPALDFLSDPLWQRVALALLHFVWQGAAVGLLLFTVLSLVSAAQVRYWIALGAMAMLVACPLVTMGLVEVDGRSGMIDPHPNPLPQGEGAGVAIDVTSVVVADDNNWREAALNVLVALRPYVLLAWLAGVCALGARLLTSYLLVRRVRSSAVELRHPLLLTTYWLARKLRLRGKVRIAVSHAIEEALVLGLWRPLILVPASWLTEMPAATLEAIIAHELAHIRRHDLWVNLAQRVVETLLFYHPAVWYVSRVLRVEREQCCDLLAVAATGERLVYVEALELVASRRLAASPALLAAAMGGTKPMNLLARVQNVLGLAPSTSSARYWPVGVAALVLPAGMWCASLAFSPAATAQEEAKEQDRPKAETKIDEFVRERLEKLDVPGPDGRAVFLRRLMLDVAGQVPTKEQIEQFQKGGEEDARHFIRTFVLQAKDQPREERREGEGDRPRDRAPAREGDQPREGDRPRDRALAREGDRPREGADRAPAREGDRPREGDAPREGDRPRDRAPAREGDRPREGGDRAPLGDRVREGDRPREGGEGRDVMRIIDEQMRLIREMRNEVQQLRRELNELRERRGQEGAAEGLRRVETERRAIREREEALRALQGQRDEAAAQRDQAEAVRRQAIREVERARAEAERATQAARQQADVARAQAEEAVKRAAVKGKRVDADRLEDLRRAKEEAIRAAERKKGADEEAARKAKEDAGREKVKEGEKKDEEKAEGKYSVRSYNLPADAKGTKATVDAALSKAKDAKVRTEIDPATKQLVVYANLEQHNMIQSILAKSGEPRVSVKVYALAGDGEATKKLVDSYLTKDPEAKSAYDAAAKRLTVKASPESQKLIAAVIAKTAKANKEKDATALKEKTESALKEVQLKLESVAKEKGATKIILDKVKAEKAPAKKEAVKKADKDASKEERKEKEVTKEREDKAEAKSPKTTIVLELKKEKQDKDAKAEEKSETKAEKEDKEEKDEDNDD